MLDAAISSHAPAQPAAIDGGRAAAPPRGLEAVAFEAVGKSFGATLALHDVNLAIPAGQTVALLGRNGAGKSTAINVMLGLLTASSGSVRTLGLDPRAAIAAGRVGSMLQSAGLPAGAAVGELVELARALYPHPLGRDDVLERAGLASLARRRVETLSGGELQRVRFALAIAGDPDLIFLDEPTVAMDVESRRAFWDDMRRFAAGGRTVLFATHYLDEADQVADRILVLERGRLVADGSSASIKAAVAERRVRFTLPGADRVAMAAVDGVIGVEIHGDAVALSSRDADATVRALAGAGVPFRDIEVAGPSLERAFLALTGASPDAA
ncbi:MAG TPA: ABC transporter ATP-binding protein [Candidatus Limnocylindrales bacterium]